MNKTTLDFLRKIGSKGGKATLKKHGKKYMSKLAKLRWKKIKKK